MIDKQRRQYDPGDWYWIVRDKNMATVFASKRRQYVDVSDAEYLDWKQTREPTSIATEAELKDVLKKERVGFASTYTDADEAGDRMQDDLFFRALIKELAARFGVSVAVLVASIKSRV